MMANAVLLLLSTGLLGQMNETFEQDFPAGQLHPMVELFGPDVAATARHTGRGLQITLPSQRASREAVGVATKFHISGDFELTLEYELLQVQRPQQGLGAGVKMWCQIGGPDGHKATIAHLAGPQRPNALTSIHSVPDADGKPKQAVEIASTESRAGKLRLSRTGTKLKYQAAERGSEVFRDLYEAETTTDDVRSLRISANTHGAATALDLQLTALTIRADRLPSLTQAKAAGNTSLGPIGYVMVLIGMAGGGYAVWHFRDRLKLLLRCGAGK